MNPGAFQGITRDFTGDGGPRRQIITLTASNAALPIPSWAQGGKGIVYVTGCGGGGGGGGLETDAGAGLGTPLAGGGGSGAWAIDFPIYIPAGVATLNAQVGAGGAAGINDADGLISNNIGGNGGATTLAVDSLSLILGGGGGGESNGTESSGVASGGVAGRIDGISASQTNYPGVGISGVGLGNGYAGLPSNAPSASSQPFSGLPSGMVFESSGGSTPFGKGGFRAGSGTGRVLPAGYGSGGSGARSGGAASSAGAPGLLILEFVEGV